jgi:hypothetical protein
VDGFVFALLRNKKSKLGIFFGDYIFWFGIISTLVGMFANVDFIKNPTLTDYENVKSIAAHATLLFNVLLLPLFGYIKIDVKRNMLSILFCIVEMAVIGGYCNLVFHALAGAETAYNVNAMFLIHSPFEGLDFLTYPIITLIAIPIYFGVFVLCDLLGGQFQPNSETIASGYFSMEELPPLSENKTTSKQIRMCFDAYHADHWDTVFD